MLGVFALRLVVAAIFAVAASAKLLDRPGTRRALGEFRVPRRLVPAASIGLPLFEAAVVVLLTQNRLALWGAAAATIALAAFTAVIAITLAQGRAPTCNCFGSMDARPIGARTLIRNAGLLALSGATLVAVERTAEWGPGIAAGLLLAVALLTAGALLARRRMPAPAAAAPLIERESLGIRLGEIAPGFTLPDLDGRIHTLQDETGRLPVLLVFTDPGCGPCRYLAPRVGGWQRELAGHLTVLAISSGEIESNRREVAAAGLERVLLQHEHEVAEAYGYIGTPAAVVVGRDGLVASPLVAGEEAIAEVVAAWAPGLVDLPEPDVEPEPEPERADRRGILTRAGGAAGGAMVAWLGFGAAGAQAAGCPAGATQCGTCCANLQTDPLNCGDCGNACPPGAVCAHGLCCKSGWLNCNGVCVNPKTNSSNCGSCGAVCAPGSACSKGRCCTNGQITCHGACIDPATDTQNCGKCGHTCPAGQVCAGGVCTVGSCAPGQVQCPGGICADLSTDVGHCGSCANACAPGATCVNGVCSGGCPPDQLECHGDCCPPGYVCDPNGCLCQGAICATGCTDTQSDLNNCGSCGNACPPGATCQNGNCVCPPGQGLCEGACMTFTDLNNCGGCGVICPGQDTACATRTCINGTCGVVYAPDSTPCGPGMVCDGTGNCV